MANKHRRGRQSSPRGMAVVGGGGGVAVLRKGFVTVNGNNLAAKIRRYKSRNSNDNVGVL